jgi:DNA-binding MarR family transcriptional regulator
MSRDRRELEQALGAAMRTYQRSVDAFDEVAADYLGINRTDLRCMDVLLEQGQATPGYLADALGLTTGSVTAMLDRLEKLNYVERRPDPTDRRRIEVRPTAQSVAVARKLWGPLVEEGGRSLGHYSKADLELLIRVLRETEELQDAHTERVRAMLKTGKARPERSEGTGGHKR